MRDVQVVGNIVVLLVLAALVSGGVYLWREQRRRRREHILAVAAAHGLEVDVPAKKPPPLGFDLFGRGSSKRVSVHMWRAGEQDSTFQYEYTVKSGDSSRTYRFTAALVALPFRAPHVVISTENWWTRTKRLVGLRDVEIESPEFNDRYHVRCDDERFAVTLLDPAMIAWMLSPQSGRGTVTFELRGPWLLCHCSQLRVEELPGMLGWAQSIRHELPAVLSDLYGGAS